MCRHQCKTTRIMKNQRNMIISKEKTKVPITDPKEMEIYKLPNKEFKIIR